MFVFIRKKYNYRMEFDPSYPSTNMCEFKECKWKDFFGKLKEAIYPNTPEEMVKEVDLLGYIDNDHKGEKENKEVSLRIFHLLEY